MMVMAMATRRSSGRGGGGGRCVGWVKWMVFWLVIDLGFVIEASMGDTRRERTACS